MRDPPTSPLLKKEKKKSPLLPLELEILTNDCMVAYGEELTGILSHNSDLISSAIQKKNRANIFCQDNHFASV